MSTYNHKDLAIGDVFVGKNPTIVSTILGSCVSVCIFSEAAKVGGITHFALPDRSYAGNSERNDLNFGDLSIKELLKKILSIPGLKKSELKAKITGGSDTLGQNNVGKLNLSKAREVLRAEGIEVVGEHVGGTKGRKVIFYTDTGRLRVSYLEETKEAPATAPATNKKIKILIVDDSKVIQNILKKVFSVPDFEVIATASNAEEAEKYIHTLSPDVITLDIHMPGMDGVTLLKRYITQYPIPTVMVTSININESDLVLKALELGAVDYIQKPSLEEINNQSDLIVEKIRTASTIKVQKKSASISDKKTAAFSKAALDKVLAIGASTGGTEAIKEVLLDLPNHIPPTVIVQHIPPVFSFAFAKRLNELCPFEVKEAEDGDELLPDRVLIAPGGKQMEVVKRSNKLFVRVFDGEKVSGHKPSVNVLFNSVAQVIGRNALGVILTGMGNDGASGLLSMRKSGSITIGQDKESSVVYGMPKAAFEMGAVEIQQPLKQVAHSIVKNMDQLKSA